MKEVLLPPELPEDWRRGDLFPRSSAFFANRSIERGMGGGPTILDHRGQRESTADLFRDLVLNAKTVGRWGLIRELLGV